MRLLYVYFGPLDVNSAIQAHHFGNELTRMGWEVTIAGEGDAARAASVGEPHFECISHDDLSRKLAQMAREPKPTIVVGWTPREPVRRMTMEAVRRLGCPYVVHLEDNEELLIESASRRSLAELQRLPLRQQDKLAPPTLIHPTHYREFLDGAAGITVITEALNDFNLAGRPHALARPGIDLERFHPDLEPHPRRRLGLAEDDFVLVYHGTIHYANQHEMLSLYLAVKLLQRRGHRVRLLRVGHTEFGGPDPRSFRAIADGAIEVGPIRWREIPAYLAVADAYVQPGVPTTSTATACPRSCRSSWRWGGRLSCRTATSATTSPTVRTPFCWSRETQWRSPSASKSCSPTASWPRASAPARGASPRRS